MNATQKIFRVRRNYNQWVNNQTLEDYALRFTAKRARRWSLFRVANTALGAISFLVLEAIGGALTLSFGFDNAALAIVMVSTIIFLTGIPICYYAAKYGVDIDLLTRGAGFGYIGSTLTSLIYASFTFIFFALEAAIMATILELMFGLPLAVGYVICALIVIPIVTLGITLISRFQLWTQPLWVVLQLAPFIWLLTHEWQLVKDWTSFPGLYNANPNQVSLIYFGAASAVLFSLIAQIGEQVDFLRFLPPKTKENRKAWWCAMLSGGPGWIVVGALKIFAGSLLAYVALSYGIAATQAADPARMYTLAFGLLVNNPQAALAIAGIFVIVSQLKINVTNAYAGSIAWSNFFSRLTHSHPGRVVWLIFNVLIALLLMEIGVYQAFENTLRIYGIVAVAWLGALVADLIINKPLGLSPRHIEFRRAYLHDINPVGVGSMVIASATGILCYIGVLGDAAKALAHYITLGLAVFMAPVIALLTKSRFYTARSAATIQSDELKVAPHSASTCCICQNEYEGEDMAWCPAYEGAICSLCCSLDSRCNDVCKNEKTLSDHLLEYSAYLLPKRYIQQLNSRLIKFTVLLTLVSLVTGVTLALVYVSAATGYHDIDLLLAGTLWKVFFVILIIAGVIVWLFVLAHESKVVAQEESLRQNTLFMEEIEAHKVTDKKLQEAKDRAEAANNAKSRYLTGISHELRTPLNSLLGYAQLLEYDMSLPESKRHKLSVIRRSGEHLADLIEGLLDISKIEAGRLDIHQDRVRIKDLLNQIEYMFRLQAENKGLQFNYTCLSPLPDLVQTDEKRLRQILINLLSNAIKFTQAGTVDFSIRYRNHVAEFVIRDSGIGIPEEDLERIFLPFERVRRPGVPQMLGTGLGLTITRLLTEILGGDIEVKNNPGGGVTFTVKMMLARVSVQEAEPANKDRPIYGYKGEKKTLMVVDDEAFHRGLISDLLSPLGFFVLEAPSAEDCLASCQDFYPDLFLLDISMPQMDGKQLAETLRKQGCDKPIIMVSALASPKKDLIDGLKPTEGSQYYDDYLVKPVKLGALLDKIGGCLQLEWIYDLSAAYQTLNVVPAQTSPTPALSELPHQNHIEELIYLAEIGHLSELKKRLGEMLTQGYASPAFIEHIQTLLTNVELDKILLFLKGQNAEGNTP